MPRPVRRSLLLTILLVLAAGCGGDSTAPPAVASITLEVVTNDPRVGETANVGATPVDASGRTLNVPCKFKSSAPNIAAVDSTTGAVTALGPGAAVITVTCGSAIATTTITVRPPLVTLTITTLGAPGSIFADPIGPTYDAGTPVTITATPLNGSTFAGWGGACAGAGVAAQCHLVLNANAAVSGTFVLQQNFAGNMTSTAAAVTIASGCRYSVSVTGPLTVQLTENSDFTVSGNASIAATVRISVTGGPAGVTCTSTGFNTTPTGALSGNDSRIAATLADNGNFRWPIVATRSGSTISGSGSISEILHDNNGNAYPVTMAANFTITRQ